MISKRESTTLKHLFKKKIYNSANNNFTKNNMIKKKKTKKSNFTNDICLSYSYSDGKQDNNNLLHFCI